MDIETLRSQIQSQIQCLPKYIEFATWAYKTKKAFILSKRHVDRQISYLKSMDLEQVVPEANTESYEEVMNELKEIHEDLKQVHTKIESIILRTKIADKKIQSINKVEKIVRQYNNLT